MAFGQKPVEDLFVITLLRGEPSSESYNMNELRASIVDEDVEVVDVITERWNVYDLTNGILEMKVKNSPINVSKTSKFDSNGLPIYLVDSTANIKIRRK